MSDIRLPDGTLVHDADTITPPGGRSQRFGVGDAPEVTNPHKFAVAQPGAEEATQATALALSSGEFAVTPGEKDRYGRDLVAVNPKDGGPSLPSDLIAAGLMKPGHWKTIDDGGASFAALTRPGAEMLTGGTASEFSNNEDFQFLAGKARDVRLNWLQQRIDSGAMAENTRHMAAPTDPRDTSGGQSVSGITEAAWDRGVDNTQSLFYGFANALGSATGADVLARWGEQGVAENIVQAMRNPATVATYEDIDGLADFGIYALEAVVENSPQILIDLGVGAGTGGVGLLGKQVLAGAGKALLRSAGGPLAVSKARQLAADGLMRSSAKLGVMDSAKAGAMASMYAQATGETQNQLVAEGIDSPGTALLVGIPKAALDYVGLHSVLSQGLKGLGKNALTPATAGELLRSTGKAAGLAMTAESVTEAAQTLMDELAIQSHKPEYEINGKNIFDALLKGGLAGGAHAGGAHALVGAVQMGMRNSQVQQDTDAVTPTAAEPLIDVEAQVQQIPEGQLRHFTADNAQAAIQVAEAAGKAARVIDGGHVQVANTQAELDAAPTAPTEADNQRLLGFAQTKEQAMADPEGAVVVQAHTPEGAVVGEQLVGKSVAAQVAARYQQQFPGASIVETTPEQVINRRSELAAPAPAAEPAPAVPARDMTEELAQAGELGIDLSRFVKTGLGIALIDRVKGGLKASVPGNKQRRLDSLEPLAKVLDVPAQELTRQYYDARNVIKGRDQLHERFNALVQEKFGGPTGFAKAIDQLPALEAQQIQRAFDLKEQGGVAVGELRAEIKARSSTPTPLPIPEVDLDSPTPVPAPKAQPDVIRDAVFNTPSLRQLIATPEGQIGNRDHIESAIEKLGTGERLRIEETLKRMDIDVGGKNRESFLQLLHDSVAEKSIYGIGKSQVEDTESDGTHETIATVEFDPSALDSEDARLLQLVAATPLTDKAKNGWPAGLSLYTEALAKIVKAGEATEQESALNEQEASTLRMARQLGGLINAAVHLDPRMEAGPMIVAAAKAAGVTDELMTKAAGQPLDVATGMQQLVKNTDGRAANGLLTVLSRQNALDSDRENLDATLQALATNPDGAIRGLVDSMKRLNGTQALDNLSLITLDDDSSSAERVLTATSKGHDAGRGESVAVNEHAGGIIGEQEGSDRTFFGRMRALTAQNWTVAVLPSAEQLKTLTFSNPLAQTVTQRFGGQNLLALPDFDGTLYGRVIDAVGMANFAQGGEKAPSNPAEAAGNLLENLSRMMAGAQTNYDPLGDTPRAVVRRIPDDLVIYVDPVTAKPVTFGEALSHRREGAHARLRQAEVQKELEILAGQIETLADELGQAASELETHAPEHARLPKVAQAITLWRHLINGDKRAVEGQGRSVYHRKPTRQEDAPLWSAVTRLGRIAVGDSALSEAFDRYKSLLGQRSRLAKELAQLREDGILQRGGKLSRGEDKVWSPEGERSNIDAPRGSASFMDDTDPEYNAYEAGPLSRFGDEAIGDLDDRMQDARLAALIEAAKGRVQQSLSETLGRTEQPRGGNQLASTRSVTERPLTAKAKQGNDRVFDSRFRDLVAQLRKTGVPLPELRIAVLGKGATVESEIAKLRLDEANAQQMRDSANTGDSAYFLDAQGVAHILIAERQGTTARAHQLADLAHELGHAVKDQVWNELQTTHRAELEMAIEADLGVKASEQLQHEWFADQFAKSVIEHRETVAKEDTGMINKVLLALLGHLKKVWATLIGTPVEANPAFRNFASSLFAGQYARVKAPGYLAQGTVREAATQGVVRYASGAADLRQATTRMQLLKTQSNRFWNKGVVPKAAPLFSMVYSRIARYNETLSRALFQPANAAPSVMGQSWEQRSRATKGRMMSQVDKLMTSLHDSYKGKRAGRDTMIQAAFEDAYTGSPATAAGQQVRRTIDALVAEAGRSGLRSVELGEKFAPVAFDRKMVGDRLPEFTQLLADRLKLQPDEVRQMTDRILHGPGVLEGVIAPGMPVGTHQTTRELVDAIGLERLMNDGWLLKKHDAALFHWVDGVSKRSAWEAVFGGERGPSTNFHTLLDQVRKDHGEGAAQEVLALVNGALGRHPAGQAMPSWWRNTQEFITGWVGMTVLAFSGVASIPELALPLVRAGGKVGIADAVSGYADAKQLARDMGIVLSDASQQVMWQMTGEQYQSPVISKMQSWFFRVNGNELIVKTSRTLATSIGVRYLLNAAAKGDNAALNQLNIDAGTVLAWDAAGRPAWSPELAPDMQVVAGKLGDALNQFVNEATLNPSKFQATHWGNNPYLKMAWHLKHFLYTYGDTVLGGMYREMRSRWQHLDPKQFGQAVAIAMPALIFGIAVMPLAAASLELRDWIKQMNARQGARGTEYEDTLSYLSATFSRAGGLGPLEFFVNLKQQQERGMSIWSSIAPVAGKVEMLFGPQSAGEKVRQMIPLMSQNTALWPFK